MARTRKPRASGRSLEGNADATPLVNPQDVEASEASIGGLFDSTQDAEGYVKVWRRDDIDKQLVFHGRFAVEEATTDRVAELFGGGSYRAQLFERNGSGTFVIVKTVSFKLPGYYKPPKETPLHGTQRQDKPASSAGESERMGTMNPSEALNTALVSQVIDMLKAVRQPQPNPLMDLLPSVIAIVPELMKRKDDVNPAITAMLQQQADELRELRREMATVAQKPSGPPQNFLELAEQVRAMRELFQGDEGGKPDPESMMWAAGLKALEVLGQGKGASVAQQPASNNPPAAGALADPNVPMWRKLLLSQKGSMLMAARFGIDPAAAAEVAVKRMPQHLMGVVGEFIQKPDHVALAMQEVPELREFERWTTDFFAAAHDMLIGGEEEEIGGEEVEDDSTGG